MKLGKTYFSGSLTFDEGTNTLGPNTSNITGSFSGSLKGTITATGNIIPAVSGAYDLGSTAFPFKDLYITQNSLKFVDSTTGSEIGRISVNSNTGDIKLLNTKNLTEEQKASLTAESAGAEALSPVSASALWVSQSIFAGHTNTNIGHEVAPFHTLYTQFISGSSVTLTGDLKVGGTVTAQEFHTEFVSASIIYQSGSTQFGDSADDTHVFTGNVGIGTSSPSAKLEVDGNIFTTSNTNYLLFGTGPTVNPYIQSLSDNSLAIGTGNIARLFISSSGNIGIGNTNPTAKLDVTSLPGENGYSLAGYPFLKWSSGDILNYGGFGATWQALTFNIANCEAIRINPSGNVGIGIIAPTNKLHVNGGFTAEAGAIIKGSTSADDSIRFYNTDGCYAYIRTTAADNNSNAWIDGELGSTTWLGWDNPGSCRTEGVYSGQYFGTGRATQAESIQAYRGSLLGRNCAGTVAYHISPCTHTYFNGGNVGIGITSTNYKLDVVSNTFGARFKSGAGGYSSVVFDGDNGCTVASLTTYNGQIYIGSLNPGGTGSNGELRIEPVVGTIMTLKSSGNVGIGTPTPSSKLTVNGRITSCTPTGEVYAYSTASDNCATVYAGWISGTGMRMGYHPNTAVGYIDNTYEVTNGTAYGDIRFRQNVSGTMVDRVLIDADSGYLRLNTSPGIQFNNDTAAANALDDYEEGTWTPAIVRSSSNPTVTYSYRQGTYTKIGNMVFIFFDLTISSISGGVGVYFIEGLPFNVQGNMAGYSVTNWRDASAIANTVSETQLKGFAQRGATYIYPQLDNSGVNGFASNGNAPIIGTGRLTGNVIYHI